MDVIVAAVVPAAGRSKRFGRMKLLADIGGEPLLDRTLRSLLVAGLAPVIVVLSSSASLDAATLLGHPDVQTVVNSDPTRGMFSSIQVGLAAVGGRPTVVLPADMPFVRASTAALVAARLTETDRVVVPAMRGQRGHPVGLPARLLRRLASADPTRSLKDALAALGEEVLVVEVDDEGVGKDVDRPEDLGT